MATKRHWLINDRVDQVIWTTVAIALVCAVAFLFWVLLLPTADTSNSTQSKVCIAIEMTCDGNAFASENGRFVTVVCFTDSAEYWSTLDATIARESDGCSVNAVRNLPGTDSR